MVKFSVVTILLMVLFMPSIALASGISIVPEGTGALPITLPTFLDLSQAKFFSFFSYIGFALSLVFVVIVILWVYLAIRGAVDIMRSQGQEDLIVAGRKRFGNVFWSITFLFGFFVVMSIVAGLFGVGSVFSWPKSFSKCENGEYYFQYVLKSNSTDFEKIDRECFGN